MLKSSLISLIRLKQTYKLQPVPQVGKIIHFAKYFQKVSVKTVSLKLNGFNGFKNNIQIFHGYIKREKNVFYQFLDKGFVAYIC